MRHRRNFFYCGCPNTHTKKTSFYFFYIGYLCVYSSYKARLRPASGNDSSSYRFKHPDGVVIIHRVGQSSSLKNMYIYIFIFLLPYRKKNLSHFYMNFYLQYIHMVGEGKKRRIIKYKIGRVEKCV